MMMLVDPNSPEDHAEAERLNERLVQRALAMGGTITGEHGVGDGEIEIYESTTWAWSTRGYACHQAGARPGKYDESGKNAAALVIERSLPLG